MLALCFISTSALAYTKLTQGASGNAVKDMQIALNILGYNLKTDGKFGSGTKEAVMHFQRANGLKVDGVAGDQTLTLLYKLAGATNVSPAATPKPTSAPAATTPPSSSGSYTKLQRGDKGTAVAQMQLALNKLGYNLTPDGNFGSGTLTAVKSFQQRYGLKADGIAGSQTLSLLYSLTAATTAPTATPKPTYAPLPTVPVTSATQVARITTTGGSLNMRSTPSKDASVLTTIPNNTIITVLTRGSQWCNISYMGRTGYVMTSYLTFITTAATQVPVPTATPAGNISQTPVGVAIVSTTGGTLNFRASASGDATVLAQIPNGTVLQLYNQGSAWCRVSYQGAYGYVMTRYLTIMNAATAQPATPTPAPTAKPSGVTGAAIVSTSGGTLNLRASASTASLILAEIPNTTVIQLLSKGNIWCQVRYNNMDGYVMTQYLTILNTSTGPAATPTPTVKPATPPATALGAAIVTTSGGTLNFRSAPSDSASVMMQIPNGSALQLLTKGNTWCMVSYNGTEGYVMTKFITILNNGISSSTPTQTPSVSVPGQEEENDPSQYTRTLRSGMYGEDVRWVQERLKELQYTVNVTGTYDATTIEAVKFFQSQNGLTSDGLAGQQTFAMLNSSNARTANDKPLTFTTLRIDDQSSAVRNMQTRLKALGYPVTVNGEYDCETHNAVVAFQVRNDLVISGIADALTQQIIYAGNAKTYATPVKELEADAGKIAGPSLSQVQLLHWFNDIKPTIKSGQTVVVYDPATSLSWNIKLYSLGRHADSQPATWRDTQIMNRSFGKTNWTCHPVYVMLPDGRWTLASMHNRPHLYGSINNNGFGGHLCIHFLRDMDECKRNDPNYGVQNQNTIRNTWKALTGITVN